MLTLPRTALACRNGVVEGAVAADHEDVVIGDGAEGLLEHGPDLIRVASRESAILADLVS